MSKNKGFTLVEHAIVLMIIGLLLGFVLNGQPLIDSAKVKKMARDFQNVQLFINGCQDRFKTLPGDDYSADVHVGGTNPANGARNGLIEGAWNTTESADESSSGATLINCR